MKCAGDTMRLKSPKRTVTLILSLLLLPVLGAAIAATSARAQDDVTGGAPVFSKPKDQPPPDPDLVKQATSIKVRSTLVSTPVAVIDRSGDFVYDLEQKDFEILDNGTPQRILNFEQEGGPVAVVIVVQVNDNVQPLLDQVRPLASMFSELLLGAQGKAAVLLYDDRVRVAQDFSSDSDKLNVTFKTMTGRGDGARLNDALSRAIALLEQRPRAERRVIVAFSTGFDSGSETTKEDVVRRATGAEVAIYGLGFNPAQALLKKEPHLPQPGPLETNVARPNPPNTLPTPSIASATYGTPISVVPILVASGEIIQSALASSPLEFYAGYTGGVSYSHWSKKTLQDELSRVASEIQSQYQLAYAPDNQQQGGFHRIEVRVRRPGLKVRARAGYFFPEKTQ